MSRGKSREVDISGKSIKPSPPTPERIKMMFRELVADRDVENSYVHSLPIQDDLKKMTLDVDLERAYPRTAEEMLQAPRILNSLCITTPHGSTWGFSKDNDSIWTERKIFLLNPNDTSEVIKLALMQVKTGNRWEHRSTLSDGTKMYLLND